MALSKKPVNGMKDILPEEMQIRDYVQQVIKETYRNFGFTQIETPCMENIANLSSKHAPERGVSARPAPRWPDLSASFQQTCRKSPSCPDL